MKISSIQKEIHEQALKCAREFKHAEAALLKTVMMADRERVFVALGYGSLFEYCVKALGLSESVAYALISVGRKAREVPELGQKIEQGELSVSKAKKVAAVLTPENQSQWLALATSSSSREIERAVAQASPQASVRERAQYVAAECLKLQLGVSEDLMNRLRRVQDLESTRQKKTVSLEGVFEVFVEEYLQKHDPVEKAERVSRRPLRGAVTRLALKEIQSENSSRELVRTSIPAGVRHAVQLRDQGRCTYVHPGSGERCTSRRFLHLHHKKSVNGNGAHSPENMTLLCSAHHSDHHRNYH
jgi:hypothetical protein